MCIAQTQGRRGGGTRRLRGGRGKEGEREEREGGGWRIESGQVGKKRENKVGSWEEADEMPISKRWFKGKHWGVKPEKMH